MAKKKNKPLSPQELAKYKPENPIPKIQQELPLDLNNVFNLAKASGATIIGQEPKNITPIPTIKK